jgi:hypothetical protein
MTQQEDSGASAIAWKIIDKLTLLGVQIGGLAFIALTAYLVWGVYNGNFTYISVTDPAFLQADDGKWDHPLRERGLPVV